jgi:D-3-phosphoglycerate dehydrogenase / 2-oxoglutarate reductase
MSVDLKTILVSTSTFGKHSNHCIAEIKNKYNLVLNPFKRKLSEKELNYLLDEYRPIGLLAGTEKISRMTLQKAKDYLNIISRVGSGWDNIDLEYAEQIGTKVFRTIGVLNNSVAELTIGLIIDSLRNITLNNNQLKNGVWGKIAGNLLKNKTVGIIGFGEIGQTVGSLAKAFGCKVFYNDIKSYSVEWANYVSKRKLIENSDIITIHTNGDKEILGSDEFKIMNKNTKVIINTARGHLINEKALYKYLKDNPCSTACLDVFNKEPYNGILLQLNNIITTPHIGSYAIESRIEMEKMAVNSLLSQLS